MSLFLKRDSSKHMDEALRALLGELRKGWRYRWLGLGVAWLVAFVGWAAVLMMPDVYQASAKVYVDTDSLIRDVVGELAVDTGANERVRYVRERLLSRPKLEQVARDTDLDLRADSPATLDSIVSKLRTDVSLASMADGRRRPSMMEQNLYEVAYRDSDSDMALAVVRELVNAFQEDALVASQSDQIEAQRFLDQQISVYEQRLQEAERKRAEFRRQWLSYLPNEAGDYFVRLQAERAGIQQVGTDLRIAEERRATLAARIQEARDASRQVGEDYVSPAQELEKQITDLEFKLNGLMIDYTDRHPDVIATKEKLEVLRERLSELDPADDIDMGGSGLVMGNLQMALNQTDVEIAGLRSRLAQHQARERELQETVDTVISVEADLAKLNRDYGAIQSQYEELVSRRERLILGGEVTQTGEVQFEIIEPARVLPEPVAPPRLAYLAGVLLGALGVGIGFTILLAQLNPVFDSREALFRELGEPVLGSVSMAWTPGQIRNRRISAVSVLTGACLLVVAFGVVYVTQDLTMPVIQTLTR